MKSRAEQVAQAQKLATRALRPTNEDDNEASAAFNRYAKLVGRDPSLYDDVIAGLAVAGTRGQQMSLDDWMRVGDKAKELLAYWRETIADPRLAPTISLAKELGSKLWSAVAKGWGAPKKARGR